MKRVAIRECRRLTKGLGEGAKGNVYDADQRLVKQVEAIRRNGGAVVLRDLEL